jgi:hypothetical protein
MLSRGINSAFSVVGIWLLLVRISFIMCVVSIMEMLEYIFVMSKEQKRVLQSNVTFHRSFARSTELDILKELGKEISCLSCWVRSLAIL